MRANVRLQDLAMIVEQAQGVIEIPDTVSAQLESSREHQADKARQIAIHLSGSRPLSTSSPRCGEPIW
jgi:hypothetical protein